MHNVYVWYDFELTKEVLAATPATQVPVWRIAESGRWSTVQAQVPVWRNKIFSQKLIFSAPRLTQVPIWRFAIARQFRDIPEKLKNLILYNTTNGKISMRVLPHMRRSEQPVRWYLDGTVSPKAPRQEAARAKGPKQNEVQK